ncbi:MAG: ribosome silencing factor [Eggerthellaceae bacterium]|nr:ribosome silencing factor [Eggerthellaceae bacterium]
MTDIIEEKTARQCAIVAARAADAKKATDIMIQNVADLVSVTDYFVIATAANNRQVDAIIEAIEEAERKECGVKPISREGTEDGIWALLDYGNFVVHVFQPEARDYYKLELLWNSAPIVDLAEEAGLKDAVYSARIQDLLERISRGEQIRDI